MCIRDRFGEQAETLRKAGGEYGAKTGRPRRVGPIDLVATRYGVQAQGATALALTKLDVLSYLSEIPVVVRYDVDGEETDAFPFQACLDEAKPVSYTHLDVYKRQTLANSLFWHLPGVMGYSRPWQIRFFTVCQGITGYSHPWLTFFSPFTRVSTIPSRNRVFSTK